MAKLQTFVVVVSLTREEESVVKRRESPMPNTAFTETPTCALRLLACPFSQYASVVADLVGRQPT